MKQRKTWNQIYFHRAILVGYDIASIAIAEAAALLLRFEFDVAAINTEYIQTKNRNYRLQKQLYGIFQLM